MAKPKLHEVIAVAKGKKGAAEAHVTELYKAIQKPDLFDGLSRRYRPKDENGDKLPDESKNVQQDLRALVAQAAERWAELFDVTLTVDAGNQFAKADVEVQLDDGSSKVLVANAPVPFLLFLEKQLVDVRTFVSKLPTPDPAEQWEADPSQGVLASKPVETLRTMKVQRPVVLYPATDKHPAQTSMVTEDVGAGYWTTRKFTTRVPVDVKAAALARIDKVVDAVRTARERANAVEVEKRKVGEALFAYALGDLIKR